MPSSVTDDDNGGDGVEDLQAKHLFYTDVPFRERVRTPKMRMHSTINAYTICKHFSTTLPFWEKECTPRTMGIVPKMSICGLRPGACPRVEHLKVLHLGRLRPYSQILDKAGKAWHGQTL
jgi:hypothetical protein